MKLIVPLNLVCSLLALASGAAAQSEGNNSTASLTPAPKGAGTVQLADPYRPAGGPSSQPAGSGRARPADGPDSGTVAYPATDPKPTSWDGPTAISLQWEVFSLPLTESHKFLTAFKTDAERYSEIVKLTEAGNAALEELMMIRTRSGQRAKVEAINELIYPTEFVPPHQAAEPSRPMIPNPAIPPRGATAESKQSANPQAPFVPQPMTPGSGGNFLPYPSPTAFETRNAGTTLEVEPTLGPDGVTIDVTLAPELVRFLGNEPQTPDRSVMQPKFQSQKVTTSITVKSGHAFLLGTQSPSHLSGVEGANQEKVVWLSFVTAEVVPIR